VRNRRPVATGLLVGGAIAGRRANARRQAGMQAEVNAANQRASEAKMEAELAKKDAEYAQKSAVSQQAQPATVVGGNSTVTVQIPAGVSAGMPFTIMHNGQSFQVTCPPGLGPGQMLTLQVPATVAVATATATASAAVPMQRHGSSGGKELFREAMMGSAPPPATGSASSDLVLIADHHVDENSPQMRQFNIISLSKGTYVTLVEGDLVNGLGGGYKDYIKVTVPSQGGRFGMISRLVVEAVSPPSAMAPPPAVSAPPPALGQ